MLKVFREENEVGDYGEMNVNLAKGCFLTEVRECERANYSHPYNAEGWELFSASAPTFSRVDMNIFNVK